MAKRYPAVLRAAAAPWAVMPEMLLVVRQVLAAHMAGVPIDPDDFEERREAYAAARDRANALSGKAVAVIPVYGVLVPRANEMTDMSGGTSAESVTRVLREMGSNPDVGSIVLDIDSPGGMVAGIPELAAEIRALREQKPVYAVANALAASAGYWLLSQASETAMTPSGQVGSIGVLKAHEEISGAQAQAGVKTTLVSAGKYKAEGNPFEPLTAEAEAEMQREVDVLYEQFVGEIALGRNTSLAKVRDQYGEGRILYADDALAAGMVDRVQTLEQTVERAGRGVGARRGRAAAAAISEAEYWDAAAVPEMHLVVPAGMSPAQQETWYAGVAAAATASSGGHMVHGRSGSGDRRTEPTITTTEERTMDPEPQEVERDAPVAVEPQPRAGDPARDDLSAAVSELREAVAQLNAGRADQEKVDRLAEEVMDLRGQLDRAQPMSGYRPGDELADMHLPLGTDLVAASLLVSTPAAATMLHRPEADVEAFRERQDNLLLLAAAMKTDPRELKYYRDEVLPAYAALDTQTVAEGKEWVPQLMSSDLIRRVELALKVPALFRSIQMPSNPYDMPGVGVARVRGGRALENTADTGQTGFKKITPATRKVTLTAVKFAAEVLVSKEEEEDSLIPVIPFLRDEVTSQLAFDIEDATINGDTAATHMDSDVVAADDPRKVWDGLRKLATAATKTDAAAAISAIGLRTSRKKMGKYGVDSGSIVHIVSIAGYIGMLSDPNVITVDKFGPDATIRTGELAKVDGIPLIVSQFVRDDLNATGVYDASTKTKTVCITVNTSSFVYGERRGLTLQVLQELYAEYDQDALAVSLRKAFAPIYPLASEPTVAVSFDITA